jgi:hypothetical protein
MSVHGKLIPSDICIGAKYLHLFNVFDSLKAVSSSSNELVVTCVFEPIAIRTAVSIAIGCKIEQPLSVLVEALNVLYFLEAEEKALRQCRALILQAVEQLYRGSTRKSFPAEEALLSGCAERFTNDRIAIKRMHRFPLVCHIAAMPGNFGAIVRGTQELFVAYRHDVCTTQDMGFLRDTIMGFLPNMQKLVLEDLEVLNTHETSMRDIFVMHGFDKIVPMLKSRTHTDHLSLEDYKGFLEMMSLEPSSIEIRHSYRSMGHRLSAFDRRTGSYATFNIRGYNAYIDTVSLFASMPSVEKIVIRAPDVAIEDYPDSTSIIFDIFRRIRHRPNLSFTFVCSPANIKMLRLTVESAAPDLPLSRVAF